MKATFEIRDQGMGDRKLNVTVTEEGGSLSICPEGYGDATSEDGHGTTILVEIYEDRLRLVSWPDINEQDPIIADMESAKETNRKDDDFPNSQ